MYESFKNYNYRNIYFYCQMDCQVLHTIKQSKYAIIPMVTVSEHLLAILISYIWFTRFKYQGIWGYFTTK